MDGRVRPTPKMINEGSRMPVAMYLGPGELGAPPNGQHTLLDFFWQVILTSS